MRMRQTQGAPMKPSKAWALVARHDGRVNGVYATRHEAVRVRDMHKYRDIMRIARVLVTER